MPALGVGRRPRAAVVFVLLLVLSSAAVGIVYVTWPSAESGRQAPVFASRIISPDELRVHVESLRAVLHAAGVLSMVSIVDETAQIMVLDVELAAEVLREAGHVLMPGVELVRAVTLATPAASP